MPENIKLKALGLISSQTPRVIIVLIGVGAIMALEWFEKGSDVSEICIAVITLAASWVNYLIIKRTGKES